MNDTQLIKIADVLMNEEIKNLETDSFRNLIKMVVFSDSEAGVELVNDVRELVFQMPTVLFWNKVKRCFMGTYFSGDKRIRLAAKFNKDNKDYVKFVKRQILLINELDEDEKIDYFSKLTRCFFIQGMEEALYFRLAKFLVQCTSYELKFMEDLDLNAENDNTAMVSILHQYGLFEQKEYPSIGGAYYTLSSFGVALKECCLNFDERAVREEYLSYAAMEPLAIPKPAQAKDIEKLFENTNFVLDGGNASD